MQCRRKNVENVATFNFGHVLNYKYNIISIKPMMVAYYNTKGMQT